MDLESNNTFIYLSAPQFRFPQTVTTQRCINKAKSESTTPVGFFKPQYLKATTTFACLVKHANPPFTSVRYFFAGTVIKMMLVLKTITNDLTTKPANFTSIPHDLNSARNTTALYRPTF